MLKRLCLYSFSLIISVSAWATSDTSDASFKAYQSGEFIKAREIALQGTTASSYTVACRAGLVIGGYFEQGETAVKSLHQATEHCLQAYKLDPHNLTTRISLAAAIGIEGRRTASVAKAKISKELIANTLVRYPNNPTALTAMASWYHEVAKAGFLARRVLGASYQKAESYFERSVLLKTIAIPEMFEAAKFYASGKRKNKKKSLELLTRLLSKQPTGAFDRIIQDQALGLHQALMDNDKRRIKHLVKTQKAFAGIKHWKAIPKYDLPDFENGNFQYSQIQ